MKRELILSRTAVTWTLNSLVAARFAHVCGNFKGPRGKKYSNALCREELSTPLGSMHPHAFSARPRENCPRFVRRENARRTGARTCPANVRSRLRAYVFVYGARTHAG